MCSHALESKKLNISILMKFRGSRVTRSMKNTLHIPRIYTNLLVSPVSFVTWLRQSVLRCILSYAEKHYGHLWERFPNSQYNFNLVTLRIIEISNFLTKKKHCCITARSFQNALQLLFVHKKCDWQVSSIFMCPILAVVWYRKMLWLYCNS